MPDTFAPIYLDVAVAAPIEQSLSYLPPADTERSGLLPGMRLLVPLGGRWLTGYLLSVSTRKPPEAEKITLRRAARLLDDEPVFPAALIPFYRWVADYYQYPLGEVIRTALPGGLAPVSGRRCLLTPEGRKHLAGSEEVGGLPWWPGFFEKGELSPAEAKKIRRRSRDNRLLEGWERAGWVAVRHELTGATTRVRTELCYRLCGTALGAAKDADLARSLKPSEKKTMELVRSLLLAQGFEESELLPRRDLLKTYPGAGKAVKGLIDKGLAEQVEREVARDLFGERPPRYEPPPRPTAEQQVVLDRLLPAVGEKKFKTFLLHGVTGSGKTEVYLRAAEAALEQGKSVLVLVPEIALATQLEGHFLSRFEGQVALLHSGLSNAERFDQWLQLLRGRRRIVIGARSAIFAPLTDLGLVIVDEEHDGAYKQEDGLRYQGRDLAVLRGSLAGCPVLLGSATPSVASYHNALAGKYELLEMKQRVENRPLPEVDLVDLTRVPTVSGQPPLFSPPLAAALRDTLARGEQSLVFLNRRGFANLVICRDCGHSVQCGKCHVTLTLHKGRNELLCHYCGHRNRADIVCPACGSGALMPVGFGTERVEEELARILPAARIGRLDRDTGANRTDFLQILKEMHAGNFDILVGTQMIAKGHHFPRVTLVGIVWADGGLSIPDFRAAERTYQLLSQVTGRAGRGERPGRVVVQTHQPGHYSITLARRHDYRSLYEKEIGLRRSLGYPPFARLVNLRFDGEVEDDVRQVALAVAGMAEKKCRLASGLGVLGPAPAPLSKLRGKFRWQLLLKGARVEPLHELSRWLLAESAALARKRRVAVSADVDPENML